MAGVCCTIGDILCQKFRLQWTVLVRAMKSVNALQNGGLILWVRPKSNRLKPWIYDKTIYQRRNEIERLFRRLNAFRRIFLRFEKLDLMLTALIHIALIMEMINSVNTP